MAASAQAATRDPSRATFGLPTSAGLPEVQDLGDEDDEPLDADDDRVIETVNAMFGRMIERMADLNDALEQANGQCDAMLRIFQAEMPRIMLADDDELRAQDAVLAAKDSSVRMALIQAVERRVLDVAARETDRREAALATCADPSYRARFESEIDALLVDDDDVATSDDALANRNGSSME